MLTQTTNLQLVGLLVSPLLTHFQLVLIVEKHTYDNDNDKSSGVNCALQVANAKNNGGWWYNNCWNINPNINYNPAQFGSIYLAGPWYNPRWIEMKIRPRGCKPQ